MTLGIAALLAAAPDLYADTWVATDALGRKLPLGGEVRAPRKDRFVGMFYFVWQGFHGTPGPYDITKILAANPRNEGYGKPGEFHWWGEPEVGYYRATDPWVARRNLQMLGEAGVDCLFIDVTNAFTYRDEVRLLFETATKMRAQGDPTPQIAFILNAHVIPTLQRLWDDWYKPGLYPDLWFRWQGKPLILADPNAVEGGKSIPEEIKAFFTWRRSWFESDPKDWFGDGRDKWPWRDRTPQNYGWHDDPKVPEEVAIGVASHPIGLNIGRSFRGGKRVEVDAQDMTPTYRQGLQFQEQWDRALAVDPKLVFVTGWNEWVAQRFLVAKGQGMNLAGRELKEGETFFVDQYNAEFSRDADPMKGGYTDDYYYQLVANVRRYKGARPVPRASAPKTIRIAGGFDQWRTVGPEYRDAVGDTLHRDHPGWGTLHYRNDTGRNDIVAAKVARDAKSVSFYVRTAAPLTTRRGPKWMRLYLDTDRNAATGLHGYDLRVAGGALERWQDGWKQVAAVTSRVGGNEMHLAVPKRFLKPSFDFKWADNSGEDGLFLDGDAAPPRRFNYRYQE